MSTTYAKDEESFETARKSAKIAGYSLSKTQRWLHEVALKRIDPATGLYIADGKWNYFLSGLNNTYESSLFMGHQKMWSKHKFG